MYSRQPYLKNDFKVEVKPSSNTKGTLSVKGDYVGGNEGRMNWVLENDTDNNYDVVLVRGAVLNINGQYDEIPSYLFGRYFSELYYLVGLAKFITNEFPTNELYNLAVIDNRTIGFVFHLPAGSTLIVPEYGFINLVNYNAELYPVKRDNDSLWFDVYNYNEIFQYEEQTGIKLGILPDPIYFKSATFSVPYGFLGYQFNERLLINIPNEINEGEHILQRLISYIKKLF